MYKNILDIDIKFPCNIFVCGDTQSGKTILFSNIVKKYNDTFDYIIAIGKQTHKLSYVNNNFQFENINVDMIDTIWEANKTLCKHILFILDDILGENFLYGPDKAFWNSFISSCRHNNISLIMSVQILTGVNPAMRKNVKYVFITDCDNRMIDDVYPYTNFKTKAEFRELADKAVDYKAIFINRDRAKKGHYIIDVPMIEL